MKNSMFGSMVASAVAGLMVGGVALASEAKKEEKKAAPAATKEAAKAADHWCKSNSCAGAVAGAKNSCNGKMACQGITKEQCTKDEKGTWTNEPKPS